MTLNVALTHRTSYTYDRLIGVSPQVIRLRPAPHCRTPILSYSLTLEPELHFLNWQQDPFGNFLARVVIPEKTRELSVTVDLVADMSVINPFDFFIEEASSEWPFAYEAGLAKELQPYLVPDPAGPRLRDYLAGIDRKPRTTIDFLCDLNRQIQQDIKYLIRMEPGVQTPEETLGSAAGSCRDSGWLLVQIARHLGLAARFVSGYLIQLIPDVKSLDGPSGADRDFTDLHAWTEIYVPGAGWIGLDPTSGLLTGEGHIPLAATPAPSSAAPISGSHEKAEVTFSFDMGVTRIAETPAGHQTLLGRAVGADRRPGARRRPTAVGRRRAADDGRRADLRLGRRHGRRGVEHRSGRPDQAAARGGSRPAARAAVRSGRPAALRSGQVVSGRATCPDGHSRSTGVRMDSRSGTTRR